MIDALIRGSLKSRGLVILMLVGLAASGIYSLLSLPIDAVPDITNVQVMALTDAPVQPIVSAREIQELHRAFAQRMRFTEEFFSQYKGLVFQIRAEGVSLSDRRVVKLLKLFAASAFLDGRAQPDARDFFVMKHIWNNEDQASILDGIVQPVLEAFFREHPERRRVGAMGIGVEALAGEIDRIRQVLAWTLLFLAGRRLEDGDAAGARRDAEEALAAAESVGRRGEGERARALLDRIPSQIPTAAPTPDG